MLRMATDLDGGDYCFFQIEKKGKGCVMLFKGTAAPQVASSDLTALLASVADGTDVAKAVNPSPGGPWGPYQQREGQGVRNQAGPFRAPADGCRRTWWGDKRASASCRSRHLLELVQASRAHRAFCWREGWWTRQLPNWLFAGALEYAHS